MPAWRVQRDADLETFRWRVGGSKRERRGCNTSCFEQGLLAKIEGAQMWTAGVSCQEPGGSVPVSREFSEEALEQGEHWETWHQRTREEQQQSGVRDLVDSSDWRKASGFAVWRGQVWQLASLLEVFLGFVLKGQPVSNWWNSEIPYKSWGVIERRWLRNNLAVWGSGALAGRAPGDWRFWWTECMYLGVGSNRVGYAGFS